MTSPLEEVVTVAVERWCADPDPTGSQIADNELFQQRLRKRAATSAGRRELRERVPVEHRHSMETMPVLCRS